MVRIHAGEPNSEFTSGTCFLLFLSTTFLVRVAQNFEGFEQGGLQRAVFPDGLFHHSLEEPSLLDGGLLKEQLACPACQPGGLKCVYTFRGFLEGT